MLPDCRIYLSIYSFNLHQQEPTTLSPGLHAHVLTKAPWAACGGAVARPPDADLYRRVEEWRGGGEEKWRSGGGSPVEKKSRPEEERRSGSLRLQTSKQRHFPSSPAWLCAADHPG